MRSRFRALSYLPEITFFFKVPFIAPLYAFPFFLYLKTGMLQYVVKTTRSGWPLALSDASWLDENFVMQLVWGAVSIVWVILFICFCGILLSPCLILYAFLNFFSTSFFYRGYLSDYGKSQSRINLFQKAINRGDYQIENQVFKQKDFSYHRITHAGLSNRKLEFLGCSFYEIDFQMSNFIDGSFYSCDFTNCNFSKASFRSVNLYGNKFFNCNFEETSFAKSELSDNTFVDSHFIRTKFKAPLEKFLNAFSTYYFSGEFKDCFFTDINFSHTDFSTKADFRNCKFTKILEDKLTTRWPKDIKEDWKKNRFLDD